MNFQFHSPPINAEYFRRRWTIRFCILGLTMQLVDSAALLSINLTSRSKGFSKATILLSLTPLFFHSLQLVSAVVLLRSQRKDLKFLKRCSTWCWRSKLLMPLIAVEALILSTWELNLVINILTISFYVIAVVKVNYVINNQVLVAGILKVAVQQSRAREQWAEAELTEERMLPEDDFLPSYAEAVKNRLEAIDSASASTDLPPNYYDLILK